MISKEKLDFAVKQVVDICLKAKKGEKACVITDEETKHIGLPIAERLKLATGNVKIFLMEDYGPRPADGINPLKLPKEVSDMLAIADVSVYAADGKKNEYGSFRRPMLNVIATNKKLRHGHMIGIKDNLMETGMAVDYNVVADISSKVFDIVAKAKKIRVTTQLGSDFTATFNPNWTWGNDNGFIKPGHMGNLPAGEVFTCPKTVDGKVIVDGILGDDMLVKYGPVAKNPLTLEIKDGYVVSFSCPNKELEKDFKEYTSKGENANRIGEFAIGTNIGLKEFIGNLLQDEKFPSVHIAVGDAMREHTGADWSADVHMDMVITKTTVEVDGRIIMKDGKFQL